MSGHDPTAQRHSPASYARYTGAVMAPWTDDLIARARLRDGDRVLDLACGTGLVASRVKAAGGARCRVTGLDINEGMLATARQIEGIEWVHGDAADLPFPDASFDAVLNCVSVDYLVRPVEVYAEVARVLRPGGVSVCTFSNRCFPSKAIRGWLSTDDATHCAIVAEYHRQAGGFDEPVAEQRKDGRRSDPLWAVWARRVPFPP